MRKFLKRKLKFIFVIVLGFVLIQITFQPFTQTIDVVDCSRPNYFIEDSRYLNCIHQKGLKSVQLLTELFDFTETWGNDKIGQKAFEQCPVNRCFAFRSHSNQPFEESDGVIVHVPNLYYMPDRKTYRRRAQQLWSFYTLESQRLSLCLRNFAITDLDDWFNLTKTVKSEFNYFSYDLKQLDKYEQYRNGLLSTNKHTARNSKKLAFWFVSKCNTFSKRENLVKKLSQYIQIDIYGRCNIFNRFKNSKPDPCQNRNDQDQCFRELYDSYKFYLSFENTKCRSYITEKFFKFYHSDFIFEVDVVPIVRGAHLDDYLKIAPSPKSFIFADSFETPKALADYLLYLDGNDTAYDEYLAWKRKLIDEIRKQIPKPEDMLKHNNYGPLCDLCEKLHNETYLSSTRNEILKISEYYNPARDCERDYPGQTEEELYSVHSTNCFWAEYHNSFIYMFVKLFRLVF